MGKQLKLQLLCCKPVPVDWLESLAETAPTCSVVFPICGHLWCSPALEQSAMALLGEGG